MLRTDARKAGKSFITRLSPVINPIFTFLESGSQEAYKFIDGTGAKVINKFLFSDIVRDHVCRKLDELKLTGTLPFARIYAANSSIRVRFDGITLKVLRPGIDEDGDAVLPPARSNQQELFYGGNYYTGTDRAGDIVIQHLVMLWQSDHGTRSTSAWLACPEQVSEQAEPKSIFCESIPHPATLIVAPPLAAPKDDDSDLYQRKETETPLTATGEDEGEDE